MDNEPNESTHQNEIVNSYRGLLNWGQRVAGECGIVGTQSNFKVIEDTLNRQKARIADLEAQAAMEAEMNDEYKARGEQVAKELAEWLQRIAAESGAAVSDNNTEVIERTLSQQRERIAELEADYTEYETLKTEHEQILVELETTTQQWERAQGRIAELEAELQPYREFKASAAQLRSLPIVGLKAPETIAMEAELNEQIKVLEAECVRRLTLNNKQLGRIKELEAENASQRNHISMLEQQAATYGRWLRELKDENAALVSQSAGGAGVQMEYQKIEYNKGQDFNDHIPNEWTLFAFYPSDENHFDIAVWQRPARSED
jgi:chromosome segregation ATPase